MKDKEIIVDKKYIPLDKYWIIRMGFLDIVNRKEKDIIKIIGRERRKKLGGDVSALLNVAKNWSSKKEIKVGESGTLFRYLQFAIWKLGLDKKLIKSGTLSKREIYDDRRIINWSLTDLLKLDKGTSQWASAAVLLGNEEKLKNTPYFLRMSYEAAKHWRERRAKGLVYDIKYDQILLRQAQTFLGVLNKKETNFTATNPDDYCFARAFGFITKKEGKEKFPAIQGHESNRLDEMEKCLKQLNDGKIVETDDHRVVQAIAMLARVKNKKVKFSNKECVNKSWPQFWDFLSD